MDLMTYYIYLIYKLNKVIYDLKPAKLSHKLTTTLLEHKNSFGV